MAHWLNTRELNAYTSYSIVSKELLRRESARVRSQRRALSEQQLELNYRGVAIALRDRHGEMLGALSVTMPIRQKLATDAVARELAVLVDTAQAMRHLI